MNFLFDTQLLVWVTAQSSRLSTRVLRIIEDPEHRLYFSVISVWEIAIKRGLKRPEFTLDPSILRHDLMERGYLELTVTGAQAVAIEGLPLIHKDPFDRMLAAQAMVEGITLLTVDSVLAQYPCPVRLV
jgi:PIN domain nuclease of toxin-antitoxin system